MQSQRSRLGRGRFHKRHLRDATGCLEVAQIENELVCTRAIRARVQHLRTRISVPRSSLAAP